MGLQRVTGVFSARESLVESSGGLNVGLAGLVFASFCAVGQALERLPPPAANRNQPIRMDADEAGLVPASLGGHHAAPGGTCAFQHGPLARHVNVC